MKWKWQLETEAVVLLFANPSSYSWLISTECLMLWNGITFVYSYFIFSAVKYCLDKLQSRSAGSTHNCLYPTIKYGGFQVLYLYAHLNSAMLYAFMISQQWACSSLHKWLFFLRNGKQKLLSTELISGCKLPVAHVHALHYQLLLAQKMVTTFHKAF